MEDGAGAVLDLGCGNGALLERLCERCPGITPVGLERDPERAAHAPELSPGLAGAVVVGDLLQTEAIWQEGRRYAMPLLMPGRLVEARRSTRRSVSAGA